MSNRLRGSIVMRQSRVDTLVTEEPDDRIGHVRLCGGMESNDCLYPETALCTTYCVEVNGDSQPDQIHLTGEAATGPIARPLCRLAALQLLAIACYYSSSCLARRQIGRTLSPVQLLFLG